MMILYRGTAGERKCLDESVVGVGYVFTSTEPLMFVKHSQWHLVTIVYQEEVLILKYDMMMGTPYHCWKQNSTSVCQKGSE